MLTLLIGLRNQVRTRDEARDEQQHREPRQLGEKARRAAEA